MPTKNEIRVLNLLSATDLDHDVDPGKVIQDWGNEAITVACEAALGSYPGLDRKTRYNAVSSLAGMSHVQAQETVALLVRDPDSDVSIRALRAAGRQQNKAVVKDLSALLQTPTLPRLVAVEVVKALVAIDTPDAQAALQAYEAGDPTRLLHRADPLVTSYLPKP
jgi:hypothetical protein